MILLLLIAIIIICYYGLLSFNPYTLVNTWNKYLTPLRDEQNKADSIDPINVPGLQYAHKSKHPSIRVLNRQIAINHEAILREVEILIAEGYQGLPMWQVDVTQAVFKDGADGWKPIWVKFFGQYSKISQRLPTLRGIVEKMGNDIVLLHISVFGPSTVLAPHYGIFKGHYRYHYGLKVPQGDIGLKVANGLYRWAEGEGIQFDDTYLHSSWNKTNRMRLVIFADIVRQMNPWMKVINGMIYWLIQRTKHMRSVRQAIDQNGIILD